MTQRTTIEISKEYLHFAAAHFTLFSATERENLHGHNFHVQLDATAPVGCDGLTFDYNVLKTALKAMCDALDEQVLMPGESPYLEVEDSDDYVTVVFAGERIPFLHRDITVLPLRNVTVEELAQYFLDSLRARNEIKELEIERLTLRCASGDGQWARAEWSQAEKSE